ncbi:MAG: ImmA/IrrE family metallo-endopeptidase [Oscillospiraceae bacterium]|nr:ImmA/IrrE family metallo-endopeptidase [Oscillospiraceae bacterium]
MNRFEAARKFATGIVNKYNLYPPIEPQKIILDLGCEIREEENNYGIEAYSILIDNPIVIINPANTFHARKRFTIAHELAHIYIPWHNGDTKCNTDAPYHLIGGKRYLDTQELEANIFASELLMPSEWVKQIINDIGTNDLRALIRELQNKAETSVMACFYALENSLPSGHLFFVKKEYSDYWKRFLSKRTYTTQLYLNSENEKIMLDSLCVSKSEFHFSQYDVIHYTLLECCDRKTIADIYKNSANLFECLNILSEYSVKSILFNLQYILNSIDDLYVIFVFFSSNIMRCIAKQNSKIKFRCKSLSELFDILKINSIEFNLYELGHEFNMVIIKEIFYEFPITSRINPNKLLRNIVNELYDEQIIEKKRMSINGILSHINSTNKEADEVELYNHVKYRFMGDSDLTEFYNHPSFDLYITNKIKDMIEKRK